ncbi:related to 30S ribosomal protein S12 [Hanseniaspora guilliermondii]|uniref:Related to 30S ribosomal protein S12 n=1 Tax=Hanseniaspora guilliermondii TaxID=56406 RepID=A0A1L0FNH1_9ASCO|nr:related to 30S ribosomal protein S12 [Hanseniaspora guilliermondii]
MLLKNMFRGLNITSLSTKALSYNNSFRSFSMLLNKKQPSLNPFINNFNTQKRLVTINQMIRNNRFERPDKKKKYRCKELEGAPIRRGTVLKVMIMKPKKPNSAQRKVAKVKLSNGKVILAYIGGEGHNLQEHHTVFVRGAIVRDLVGMKYKIIRGKGDAQPVVGRVKARSKYGVKKPKKA